MPSAPVDVVSIDYVADAVLALCDSAAGVGQTYHLTAGAQASTMGEIAQLASRYFRRPLPRVLPPAEFAALELRRSSAQRAAIHGMELAAATLRRDGSSAAIADRLASFEERDEIVGLAGWSELEKRYGD